MKFFDPLRSIRCMSSFFKKIEICHELDSNSHLGVLWPQRLVHQNCSLALLNKIDCIFQQLPYYFNNCQFKIQASKLVLGWGFPIYTQSRKNLNFNNFLSKNSTCPVPPRVKCFKIKIQLFIINIY